ncbi:hypothetical protein [Mesorhizobium sp.]|uniref:hypothetical protein n=1 Tax=Mesorhizobium sp. TaxID=1871066 RepID=UPI00341A4169
MAMLSEEENLERFEVSSLPQRFQAFEASARHGSFSGAAGENNVTAAAVGQLVRGAGGLAWRAAVPPRRHRQIAASGRPRAAGQAPATRRWQGSPGRCSRAADAVRRMRSGDMKFRMVLTMKDAAHAHQ